MKTTGVSGIPKFGLLVFLGHPTVDLIFLHSEVAMLTASELMEVLKHRMLSRSKSTDDCCSAIES